jgi:hypothetical protein
MLRLGVFEALFVPVLELAEVMQEGFRREVLEVGVGPKGPLHVMHLMTTIEEEDDDPHHDHQDSTHSGGHVSQVAARVLEASVEQGREAEEQRRAQRRAARSTWIDLLETLATERGPWGRHRGMVVYWTLDEDVTDVWRRRLKLRRNEQGSRHEVATTTGPEAAADRAPRPSTATATMTVALQPSAAPVQDDAGGPPDVPLPCVGMWAELLKYQKAVNARVGQNHTITRVCAGACLPYAQWFHVCIMHSHHPPPFV